MTSATPVPANNFSLVRKESKTNASRHTHWNSAECVRRTLDASQVSHFCQYGLHDNVQIVLGNARPHPVRTVSVVDGWRVYGNAELDAKMAAAEENSGFVIGVSRTDGTAYALKRATAYTMTYVGDDEVSFTEQQVIHAVPLIEYLGRLELSNRVQE